MKKNFYLLCVVIFTTLVTHSQNIVFHENFELPSGADSVTSVSNTSNAWAINTTFAAQGTQSIHCAIQNNDTTSLITDAFSTLGNNFVILEFQHICKISFYDYAEVFVSINNGLSWTKLTASTYLGTGIFGPISDRFCGTSYNDWQGSNDQAQPTNAWWRKEEFNISSIAANQANVRIKFRLTDMPPVGGNLAYGWLIDDIKVIAHIDELFPPVITLSAPILPDTVFSTGPFEVFAHIIDDSGVDTAMLVYTVNAGPADTIGMYRQANDIFKGEIPSHTFNTNFCYYLIAIDSSLNQNTARHPQSGCIAFSNKQPPPEVTIGTGISTSASGPTYISSATSTYRFSNHISLFEPTEINAAGLIEYVVWEKANTNGYNLSNATFRIYLKHTSVTSIPNTVGTFTNELSGATLVYESTTQNLPLATGWQTFNFNTPNSFIYNGIDNLMILVYWHRPGNATGQVTWRYTMASGKAQTWSSSADPPTIGYGAGHRSNIKIGFQMTNHTYDAGISQIVEPTGQAIAGSTPVRVFLKNYGTDTLTKANIHYTFNGQARPVYQWTGSLQQHLSTNSITIGNENLVPGSYEVKAWTSLPNDSIDQNNNNDTASSSGFVCLAVLNGTYSVGGTGADFATLDDALSAIDMCGMSGPVVFELAPGIYNNQITLQHISATSYTNTISFRSSSMNPDDVVIKHNASGAGDNFVLYLNGARHMRFEYLTFQSENTSFGNVVLINNGANNNVFTGNKFIGPQVTVSSTNIALIYSPTGASSNDSNNVFRLNTFMYGSYGFYYCGPTTSVHEQGTVIDSNIFMNQYSRAIELRNQDAPEITSNYIYSDTEALHGTAATYYYGMYLYYCQNDMKILKNHIVAPKGTYGMYFIGCTAVPAREALIANNFIAEIGGFTFTYGIYVTTSHYQNYYHNSVNITSPTSNAGHALFINSGSNIRLINNIFANTGGAFCVRVNAPAAITRSNYNNLYSVAAVNWGWWNGTISDFNMWKSASGVDSNSVSMNPGFVSPSDLHVTSIPMNDLGTPIAIITDDFDGDPRSPVTPDIGADEYSPPAKDITITSVLWPRNSCALGTHEEVELIIRNNGMDSVTTFNAAYQINGLPPVVETFNIHIPSLQSDTIRFVTNANMSAYGLYSLNFYTALANDENLSNDTITNFTVFNGHDFYDSDYYTSFEIEDPTRGGWTFADLNNDNSRWHFFGGTNNSRTGMIYMGYENNQSNAGNDWFISRCFNFEANRTYELSFWYKSSDATYAQSVDVSIGNAQAVAAMTTQLISLPSFNNPNYIEAKVEFSVPVTGQYHFGFYAYSGPVATTGQVMACIDDMTIRQIPPHDAGVISIITPQNGCGMSNETVKVKIKNYGSSVITGGLSASYKIQGSSNIVTETVSGLILSGDTMEFTFSTPVNLSAPNDTIITIIAYTTLTGDTLQSSIVNDTVYKSVKSFVLPPPPVTANDTILSGNTASLSAQSSYPVKWYSDSLLNNHIHDGYNYTTPVLFNTETYYAASIIASPLLLTRGSGTITQFNIPFYGFHEYGWSAVRMKLNQTGYIDSIGWEVGNTPNNYVMPNQRVYMMLVSDSVNPSTDKPNPAIMQKVFDGAITFNGSGWHLIKLDSPFFFDDDYSLMIYYENRMGSTSTGYPNFRYTSTSPHHQALYRNQSGSFPEIAGINTYNRPNIRLHIQEGSGCSSLGVPATAIVTLPQIDAGMNAVIMPKNYVQQGVAVPVILEIKNYGNDTISNIPVNYKLNNLATLTQTYTGSLASGEIDTISFPAVAVPSGPFVLYAWTSLSGDMLSINDSMLLTGLATDLEQLPHFDDFDTPPPSWVATPSGLTNWELGIPNYGVLNSSRSAPNSWCTNLTSSYNNLANALLTTQMYDFSNAINAQMSFWINYNSELGMDGLRVEYSTDNGQSWQTLGTVGDPNATNWYNTTTLTATSQAAWSGNSGGWIEATYSLNAFSGMPGVRFRFVFNSNATGTYDGFCIDDFAITIPPALDLAMQSIANPVQNSPEGSSQAINLVVRNAGSTTITSFTAYASLNQGTPLSNTWSGNLLPGDFTSISLAAVSIPAGFYNLCAWVSLAGDTIQSNDTLCISLYGNPLYDVGIIQIINPLTNHSQGQSVPVRALIRNFGVDTLSSVQAGYKIDNNPVVTTTWTGILYPGATDTVSFPNIIIDAGQQFICVFTLLTNDFNNLNDTACKMFYGQPTLDIAPIGLFAPSGNNCNTASEQVVIRVRNVGVNTIDFSTNPLTLSANAVGVNPQTFPPVVVNTGTLAPNTNHDVEVSNSYDMSTSGVYSFTAAVAMPGDGDPSNNSLGPVSIGGVSTISSFPFYENFESGYNSALRMQPNQHAGLAVSPAAANGSQYGLHFQGGNPLGWIGDASGTNVTTYYQAFNTNSAHVANAVSCDINSTGLTTLRLRFDLKQTYSQGEAFSWFRVRLNNQTISNLNGDSIFIPASQGSDPFTTQIFDLTPWAGTTFNITLQASMKNPYQFGATPGDNAFVDNFALFVPAAVDAGVSAIVQPTAASAAAGTTVSIQVRIENFGSTALTSCPVGFQVANLPPVMETWTGNIPPNGHALYLFNAQAPVQTGNFVIKAFTSLSGDTDNFNDTSSIIFLGVPMLMPPWSDNMEGANYWVGEGNSNLWQRGTPSGTIINYAYSGSNAWVTNLSGNYTNNADEYLYSPFFDFSNITGATLQFYHWVNTQANFDGCQIQYTTNNGQTWPTLGYMMDPLASNWYTHNISGTHAWSGQTAGYSLSIYDMSAFSNHPNPIRFRFRFFSNASVNNFDGWAIDNFSITVPQIPNDAGVMAINSPGTSTVIGDSISVEIRVKNYGTDTIKQMPVFYRIQNQPAVTENWSGILDPGAELNISFNQKYSAPINHYTICAWTSLTGDTYNYNDTLCKTVAPAPAAIDLAIKRIIKPDFGKCDSSIVVVENLGTNPVNSFRLELNINNIQVDWKEWSGVLNSGDSVKVAFDTSFAHLSLPIGLFTVCFEAILSGDANQANNIMCRTINCFYNIDEISGYELELSQNVPNPSNSNTMIRFVLPANGDIEFFVTDLSGRKLISRYNRLNAGEHFIEINRGELPAGLYLYGINYDKQRKVKRMIILE